MFLDFFEFGFEFKFQRIVNIFRIFIHNFILQYIIITQITMEIVTSGLNKVSKSLRAI